MMRSFDNRVDSTDPKKDYQKTAWIAIRGRLPRPPFIAGSVITAYKFQHNCTTSTNTHLRNSRTTYSPAYSIVGETPHRLPTARTVLYCTAQSRVYHEVQLPLVLS